MKLPKDIRHSLARRFHNRHHEWLKACATHHNHATGWPLEIPLGIPTEQDALKQPDGVQAWVAAWRNWQGRGSLTWCERRWRSLGTQRVPERLTLDGPADVAFWIDETTRWSRASSRFKTVIQDWPILINILPKYFSTLANYDDLDFRRLIQMLYWICANPNSNLYPRQIPIAGIDSKWLESRKGFVSELVATIQGDPSGDRDFFKRCGLRPQPPLIRMRLLDPVLRNYFNGLGDISAPLEEIANMDIQPTRVFIVENLQTGLAFEDMAGSVVIMRLGYGVDVLGQIPWLQQSQCIYWGDIDTHGFAILSRARIYLPDMETVLMDELTLLAYRELWVEEKDQHSAMTLPLLSSVEQQLFQTLKSNTLGQQVRLEQERICWDMAWQTIKAIN